MGAAGRNPGVGTKVIFLLAILVGVVSIPYLFRGPLSISVSNVVGYSNGVAVLILFSGAGLFAIYTRGKLGQTESRDSRCGWPSLVIALLFTLAYVLPMCGWGMTKLPGGEAPYLMNRVQLLAAGLAPYRQFEFVYGPLLLYPNLWVSRLFHVSMTKAFDLTWIIGWELGVTMVWVVINALDFHIPYRRLIFFLLVSCQLAFAHYGSLSYSPFRAYFCAFCIVVTYTLWRRFRKSWLLLLCTIVSISLGICCSMDQAVGITCGLLAYLIFLALPRKKEISRTTVLLALAGAIGCFAYAERLRATEPLHSFGGGGYSYPVLPSLGIFAALFAYIVAGCSLYRFLHLQFFKASDVEPGQGQEQRALVLPLVVAGCSMIPNALGRSDILHITAAIPAFVIGVAVIFTMPSVRRWWAVAAVIGLIVLPHHIVTILRHTQWLSPSKQYSTPDPALLAQGYTKPLPINQWYVSESHLSASQLPCDVQYFSPSFMPEPTEKFLPQCLDTGYYVGFTDVITPKTIEYKVAELRRHAGQPLLMENIPLEAQLPLQLTSADNLYYEVATIWIPKNRHAPLTYAPIIDYIREHYRPGPIVVNGLLQIWYPKGGSEPDTVAPGA